MLFSLVSMEVSLSRMSFNSLESSSSLGVTCSLRGRKGDGRGSMGLNGSKGLLGSNSPTPMQRGP